MARYNSVNSTGSVAGGTAISTPASGLLTTLTGTGTVTLPNPVLYTGSTQTFYNSTGAAITLSTPSGVFTGPATGGAGTLSLPAGSVLTVISDGTNYLAQDWLGGALAINGTATFNGSIAANPTGLNVSIQPSGAGILTMSSGTTGSLDNVNVGATTTGTGRFSSLTATGTLSTSATTAAVLGTGGTGALQVSGGASVAGILNVGGKTYHADSVGIGTNNPGANLEVSGATGQNIYVTYVGGSQLRLKSDSGDSGVGTTGSTPLLFLINNAEKARIDTSGNVGIGTGSSIGAKLEVKGSASDNATFNLNNNAGNIWKFWNDNGASGLNIQYNGTTKIIADINANVGIGTTVMNVYDAVASNRPLVVAKSDASTSNIGSTASITISNLDTTTNNVSQINFAAITGANAAHFSSAIISAIHGARTNGQYPTGTLTFATSTALNNAPSEKLRIAADGQLYHNSTYLVATAYNHYWAKSLISVSPVSTGFTDVGLQWSNVFLPTNVKKVLLTFHITFRNNGVNVNHSGFRMKVTRTSDSAVTYVGNSSWGFGISQCVGNQSAQNHMTVTQHVNLLDYDSSGNQAGLAAGSTYNMMLQVLDAYGNGTTLRVAGEGGGGHTDYTPAHGSIWII